MEMEGQGRVHCIVGYSFPRRMLFYTAYLGGNLDIPYKQKMYILHYVSIL